MLRGQTRGQNAVEFLITYSWAILAVAVLLVLLGILGLPNLNSKEPERCDFPVGSFACNGLRIERAGNGELYLKSLNITNGMNKEVHVCGIRCTAEISAERSDILQALLSANPCGNNAQEISPRGDREWQFVPSGAMCRDAAGNDERGAVGSMYRGRIYVSYSYPDEMLSVSPRPAVHVASADIVSRVEIASS